MSQVENWEQSDVKSALQSLLLQLADDDFLYAFRGSEWLGLAPHIEEDVACSSISQDTMGHAAMYYKLLEDLGVGNANDLAHLRPAIERKNSILTERVNGAGYYMETPQYDWAYHVVRSYFYILAKKVKMDTMVRSSYVPLAEIAMKIKMELYYHHLHWQTWFTQLFSSTELAKEKMNAALLLVMEDFGDIFLFGKDRDVIESIDLLATEEALKQSWLDAIQPVCQSLGLELPMIPIQPKKNGRNGDHTQDLDEALQTLSEVYKLDSQAVW